MRVSGSWLLHTLLRMHKIWSMQYAICYALLASFSLVVLLMHSPLSELSQLNLMPHLTWLSFSLLFCYQSQPWTAFILSHSRQFQTRRLQASHLICSLVEWPTYGQLPLVLEGENPEYRRKNKLLGFAQLHGIAWLIPLACLRGFVCLVWVAS